MAALTTPNAARAWRPDLAEFLPSEVLPGALIFGAATVVTEDLDGDAPVARIPWVDDATASFTAEGADITLAEPGLAEVVVATAKITQLLKVSREQFHNGDAGRLLSDSVRRAVRKRANVAFLSQVAPTPPAVAPPAGIVNVEGILEPEDLITETLDPLADAIADIEANGGAASIIIAHPLAWGELRKLKTADGHNTALLGAGTADAEKFLLGVPVFTSPAAPVDSLVVIDKSAIAAAVGHLFVDQSEDVYFASDSVALRCTWRIGWGVQHPNRIARVRVYAAPSGS